MPYWSNGEALMYYGLGSGTSSEKAYIKRRKEEDNA